MPAVAATTEPIPLVARRDEIMPVMARAEVVAWLVVALRAVKFWRVVEPERRRLESVVKPLVTSKVPVRLAAEDIVCPFIRPDVMGPAVRVPMLQLVEKRLVLEAVVEKKLEVVALLPVAVVKVKA